jgi:hypothetical protein
MAVFKVPKGSRSKYILVNGDPYRKVEMPTPQQVEGSFIADPSEIQDITVQDINDLYCNGPASKDVTARGVVAWVSGTAVWFQLFDETQVLIGTAVKVADTEYTGEVAIFPVKQKNGFCVVWEEWRGYSYIVARVYDYSGDPITQAFQVSPVETVDWIAGTSSKEKCGPWGIENSVSGNLIIGYLENTGESTTSAHYIGAFDVNGKILKVPTKTSDPYNQRNIEALGYESTSNSNAVLVMEKRTSNLLPYEAYTVIIDDFGNQVGTYQKVGSTIAGEKRNPKLTRFCGDNMLFVWSTGPSTPSFSSLYGISSYPDDPSSTVPYPVIPPDLQVERYMYPPLSDVSYELVNQSQPYYFSMPGNESIIYTNSYLPMRRACYKPSVLVLAPQDEIGLVSVPVSLVIGLLSGAPLTYTPENIDYSGGTAITGADGLQYQNIFWRATTVTDAVKNDFSEISITAGAVGGSSILGFSNYFIYDGVADVLGSCPELIVFADGVKILEGVDYQIVPQNNPHNQSYQIEVLNKFSDNVNTIEWDVYCLEAKNLVKTTGATMRGDLSILATPTLPTHAVRMTDIQWSNILHRPTFIDNSLLGIFDNGVFTPIGVSISADRAYFMETHPLLDYFVAEKANFGVSVKATMYNDVLKQNSEVFKQFNLLMIPDKLWVDTDEDGIPDLSSAGVDKYMKYSQVSGNNLPVFDIATFITEEFVNKDLKYTDPAYSWALPGSSYRGPGQTNQDEGLTYMKDLLRGILPKVPTSKTSTPIAPNEVVGTATPDTIYFPADYKENGFVMDHWWDESLVNDTNWLAQSYTDYAIQKAGGEANSAGYDVYYKIGVSDSTSFSFNTFDTVINYGALVDDGIKHILNNQMYPDVESFKDGGMVTVWQSYMEDGGGWGIYGRLLEPTAVNSYVSTVTRTDTIFSVNKTIENSQFKPTVRTLEDSNFVVAYGSQLNTNHADVVVQFFDREANKFGEELNITEGVTIETNKLLVKSAPKMCVIPLDSSKEAKKKSFIYFVTSGTVTEYPGFPVTATVKLSRNPVTPINVTAYLPISGGDTTTDTFVLNSSNWNIGHVVNYTVQDYPGGGDVFLNPDETLTGLWSVNVATAALVLSGDNSVLHGNTATILIKLASAPAHDLDITAHFPNNTTQTFTLGSSNWSTGHMVTFVPAEGADTVTFNSYGEFLAAEWTVAITYLELIVENP